VTVTEALLDDGAAAPSTDRLPSLGRLAEVRSVPRRRLLVVDDDADTREMYAWRMRAAGWQVEEADCGEVALFFLHDFRPDVVLLDLRLPGLHGMEIARILKEDELTKDVVVVVCTGADRARAEPAAKAVGCAAFLTKPCTPDALHDVIEELVSAPAL
jgi:two-component system, cell cycle response regulator DivK